MEQLEQKKPTEENKPAFRFLKDEINKFGKKPIKIIELGINKFEKDYPLQIEIAEKVRIFIEDYKKIQEFIQN